MATLTVGRIAMKVAGREAGKYCVVLTSPKDNFVEVTGPKVLTGVKRRRCNVDHLEPTEHIVKIDSGATDAVVVNTLDKEGLTKKLGLKKPSPEVVKGPEMKGKKEKKEQPKEVKQEEKKEGKTLTISLPRFGRKKEEPKEEEKPVKRKPVKKPAKEVEKKETKPKKATAKPKKKSAKKK
ncbi:MAG: 50S ribosomal protein L14e [Candidatus Aenigmarchaeota archaeon]|nr:50S ribosomal protein L14e [Candidatus Aenigmarchaeota archaeon]